MDPAVDAPPIYKQFIAKMADKMVDSDSTGDTANYLRPGILFAPVSSWELVRETIVERLNK